MDIEKSKAYIRENYDKAGLLVHSTDRATYLRNIKEAVDYLMAHYDSFLTLDSKVIAEMKDVHGRILYAKSKIDADSINKGSWLKALRGLIKEFDTLEKMSNRYERELDILAEVMKSYLSEAEPLTLTVTFPESMRNKKIKVMI